MSQSHLNEIKQIFLKDKGELALE